MFMSSAFSTGLGGPGMWDPMPVPPPVKPPEHEAPSIWSDPSAAHADTAAAISAPAAHRPAGRTKPLTPRPEPAPKKKAAKATVKRPTTVRRPVKKAAKVVAKKVRTKRSKRPVKKAARSKKR